MKLERLPIIFQYYMKKNAWTISPGKKQGCF